MSIQTKKSQEVGELAGKVVDSWPSEHEAIE